MTAAATSPANDFNLYGGACRCLLRVRENGGNPVMSDHAFVERYLERFPDWAQRPGNADLGRLLTIAADLGLATQLEVLRGYDDVLRRRRAGDAILVFTERAPQQDTADGRLRRYTLLLLAMDDTTFSVWCPYPSGQEDTFSRVDRRGWDEWLAIAVILQGPPEAAPERDALADRTQAGAVAAGDPAVSI